MYTDGTNIVFFSNYKHNTIYPFPLLKKTTAPGASRRGSSACRGCARGGRSGWSARRRRRLCVFVCCVGSADDRTRDDLPTQPMSTHAERTHPRSPRPRCWRPKMTPTRPRPQPRPRRPPTRQSRATTPRGRRKARSRTFRSRGRGRCWRRSRRGRGRGRWARAGGAGRACGRAAAWRCRRWWRGGRRGSWTRGPVVCVCMWVRDVG